jgi:acetyl esterase
MPGSTPDASPLRSANFAGLPPAVILTAEHDVLRDEGELYATRLVKAGVPVRHRRFAGQMHGFFTMVDALPGAAAGLDYVAAAIEEQLSPSDQESGGALASSRSWRA